MHDNPDRRDLLKSLMFGAWTAITAALGVPAAGYLLLPPRAHKEEEWVEAGTLAQLEPNIPEELVYRRNRADGWKIASEKAAAWVVRTASDDLIAFAPQCTHLGCAYHWNEQKQEFVCPCHSSTFAPDGRVLSGPAPRPLDRLPVRVQNGRILIGPAEDRKA